MKRNSIIGKVISIIVFLIFLAAIPISTLASTAFTNWVISYLDLNGGPLWGIISTVVGLCILAFMVFICVEIENKAFKNE